MGSDISRGILEFSKGKPLGKSGMDWLKIHLANKVGQDKLPLHERIKFVEDNIDKYIKCAEDPKNNLEWLESEEPW